MKNQIQSSHSLQRNIRFLIVCFMIGLILSGITAFPILTQLEIAHIFIREMHWKNDFTNWIDAVYKGVQETDLKYPFIAYGTDWLAFAHLVIAIAFVGPLREPVRNIWVIQFGILACIAIFPLAFIAGEIRGIPLFWRLIDCTFGIVGGIVLLICYKKIRLLESLR